MKQAWVCSSNGITSGPFAQTAALDDHTNCTIAPVTIITRVISAAFLESPTVDATYRFIGKRRALTNRRALKEDNVLSHVQYAAQSGAAGNVGAIMTDMATAFTSEALLAQILTSLEDDKAEEIVKIELRGKSEMADWMVIASGRSSRQVAAIAEHLVDTLKQEFRVISKVEGKDTGDWVLIDAGDVIVHLFRPEVREFYQLEKMWLSPAEAAASTPN